MEAADARALIAHPSLGRGGPQTWADLGCGDGLFTRALASLLPAGSIVHAVDADRTRLQRMAPAVNGVTVTTHAADFTALPWPFADLDGVLMANSLHYVRDQRAFLASCATQMATPRFLLVEYDSDRANRWVPYPVRKSQALEMLHAVGLARIDMLGIRPSIYSDVDIYAILARP